MPQSPAAHRLTFSSFGVTMDLACDDAELLAAATDALPPGWVHAPVGSTAQAVFEVVREGSGARRPLSLRMNGTTICSALRMAAIVEALEGEVRMQLAQLATRFVFVHAGVVEWNGRAIVLPAKSASGKTTLVLALLQAGARYGSDEYAVIDDEGMVHPYARPLSIRQGKNLRVRTPSPAPVVLQRLAVGMVVATHYERDAKWNLTPQTPGEAVMGLFANTLAARERPAESLRALGLAVDSAVLLAGPRGDARDCVSQLLSSLGSMGSLTFGMNNE